MGGTLVRLLFCSVVCFCQTRDKQAAHPGSHQTTFKAVLSWLPGDTETIIAANGPFAIPNFDGLSDNSGRLELSSAELELRTRGLPLRLYSFKNGGLQENLKGKVVALALEGSRHFGPPAQLGAMRYEGCEVAVLGSGGTFDRDSFLKNAGNSAVRFEDIAGTRIAVFQEEQENDIWTTFVGFPRNNIVLVATDEDYLRVLLTRMGGDASGPRALPETLPEWKYVNTLAPTWGLRHYRRQDVGLDPTSPFSEQDATQMQDGLAIGLTFWFEPAVRRKATVTYLSANKNAPQILQDYLSMEDAKTASPREFQVRLRQPTLGVVEGSVSLTQVEPFYRLLFGLSAMLGHATYL